MGDSLYRRVGLVLKTSDAANALRIAESTSAPDAVPESQLILRLLREKQRILVQEACEADSYFASLVVKEGADDDSHNFWLRLLRRYKFRISYNPVSNSSTQTEGEQEQVPVPKPQPQPLTSTIVQEPAHSLDAPESPVLIDLVDSDARVSSSPTGPVDNGRKSDTKPVTATATVRGNRKRRLTKKSNVRVSPSSSRSPTPPAKKRRLFQQVTVKFNRPAATAANSTSKESNRKGKGSRTISVVQQEMRSQKRLARGLGHLNASSERSQSDSSSGEAEHETRTLTNLRVLVREWRVNQQHNNGLRQMTPDRQCTGSAHDEPPELQDTPPHRTAISRQAAGHFVLPKKLKR